jgi:hypothetical protein
MASEHVGNDRSVSPPQDISGLLERTVDDAVRLISAEVRLFQTNLKAMLEAQVDRAIGNLAALVAIGYGLSLLLVAIVCLLHLWLAWWASFAITGAIVIAGGMIVRGAMEHQAKEVTPV